jgi:hypothetical protein
LMRCRYNFYSLLLLPVAPCLTGREEEDDDYAMWWVTHAAVVPE